MNIGQTTDLPEEGKVRKDGARVPITDRDAGVCNTADESGVIIAAESRSMKVFPGS